MKRAILRSAPIALALTLSGVVRADSAAAEALYLEGNALKKAGKIDEACVKWAASLREEESAGAAFLVGECQARKGRTATAWATFRLAERIATRQGRKKDAEDAAGRAKDLEGSLIYLTIQLPWRRAGLRVERDGVAVSIDALGSKIPVDPGEHKLRVTADGAEEWTTTLSVKAGDGTVSVAVPELREAAKTPGPPSTASGGATSAPPPSGTAPPPSDTGMMIDSPPPKPASKPVAGYVLLGVGAAATGVGAFFGVRALSAYSRAKELCPTHTDCSSAAMKERDLASTRATISNVAVGAGVVALGVGAFLVLRAPSAEKTGIWSGVRVGHDSVGVTVGGAL